MKTVLDLMVQGVITVDSQSSLLEAIKIMKNNVIGAVVVTDHCQPLGIFTERDLINKIETATRAVDLIRVC